jgi:zinc transport system substrate-binding protein
MIRLLRLATLLCIVWYTTNCLAASSSPVIMVSIKPFYNICAVVMQSVGTPHLLLTKNASPHDYQLKPSDAKLIQSSDFVIWGGPELEGYLQKPVSSLANRNLNLATVPGLTLLPMRTSNNWESHCHHNCEHDHSHEHLVNDPHFWLDPDNAIIIANAIAKNLAELDPLHAKIYFSNAQKFAKEVKEQEIIWNKQLTPYRNKPYIASHDAYQYFNKAFNLDGAGAISLHPEIPPSIQRIQQIQKLLAAEQVTCIFSEPQFNDKIINTLIKGTKIHKGQLDPLGQDADLGPNGYFILIDNLVNNFVTCNK